MNIIIDTREKPQAIKKIVAEFDKHGIKYVRSKLLCGDYQSLDNARLVIDRKQDLQELCGNVCQQHERFKNELIRAIEQGIKIVILCEHGEDIKSLEDVWFWQNPRRTAVRWKTVNGKKVKEIVSAKAVNGNQLYKSLCTIRDRYNVDFVFCNKKDTGKRIIEILNGDVL
jgi:ERCC4-type nuclease